MSTGAGALFNVSGGSDMIRVPGGPFVGGTGGGSNQWMNYPSLPNLGASNTTPGGTSSGGYNYGTGRDPTTGRFSGAGKAGQYFPNVPGGKSDMGGNVFTAPTFDPGFTSQFYQMLQQIMAGSGGGLQNNLLSFLGGGPSSIPGAAGMTEMANTGDPISALPEWQSMIAAQQQNIQQNQANLKEQFGFAGDLESSPFGTAMSNYMQQTSKDENALLAQLEQQAMESAMGRKLSADTSLMGMAGAESQFLDQLFSGAATASPGLFEKNKGSLLGGIGSLIGAGAAGASAGLGAAGGGAGLGASILAGLAAI